MNQWADWDVQYVKMGVLLGAESNEHGHNFLSLRNSIKYHIFMYLMYLKHHQKYWNY